MGGISIWQLAIVLVIVLLLFGTKRLRNLGSDLGSAMKGFKNAIKEDDAEFANKQVSQKQEADSETVTTQDKQKSE